MNKLILFALTPMIIITFIWIIIVGDFPGTTIEGMNFLEDYDWAQADYNDFKIDPIFGAIGIIITIVSIGTVAGIKVLGSGLGDESIRILTIGLSYLGIWSVLTVFSSPIIFDIPSIGGIIYGLLSLILVIGIIMELTGGA